MSVVVKGISCRQYTGLDYRISCGCQKFLQRIDKNAKYIYFVISDKNNKPANLQSTKDLAKRLDSVEIYTALTNMHPNDYGIDILEAKNKVKDHLNYLDIQSFDAIMKAALI